jgi:hypothetical protein
MQRKILFALLVVSLLVVLAAVPAMASDVMSGPFEVAVRSAKDSFNVMVNTAPAGPVQQSPLLPIEHYTCYFEGIRIPCRFLSWLWW